MLEVFKEPWRWQGQVGRGAYAGWGLGLALLKFAQDATLTRYAYGEAWDPWNYLMPAPSGTLLERPHGGMYLALLAAAAPFIWAGVALTLRRLRSAGLPAWLVVFFFVPLINLLFFLLLCLAPERNASEVRDLYRRRPLLMLLNFVVPRGTWGSAVAAVAFNWVLALAVVQFGVGLMANYGWGLFIGLPFTLGLLAALIHGYHQPRTWRECMSVTLLTLALVAVGLLALAFEGAICLLMASPLALALGVAGGTVGFHLQRVGRDQTGTERMLSAGIFFVPAVMGLEHAMPREAPLFEVRTALEVQAPVERVWGHVVEFPELGVPDDLLFRAGVAYPQHAVIRGRGVGAVRWCVFSTGSFVEPITCWAPPYILGFDVTHNPPPMREWSPYASIHPPHLHGFLISRAGQFRLEELPGGRTRLEGTTWYQHRLWPSFYWRLWSDPILHAIHNRVLRHVKALAEASTISVGGLP